MSPKRLLRILKDQTRGLRARVRALAAQLRPTHAQVRALADKIADELDAVIVLPQPFEALDGIVLRILTRWLLHEAIARVEGLLGWERYQADTPDDVPPQLNTVRPELPPFQMVGA